MSRPRSADLDPARAPPQYIEHRLSASGCCWTRSPRVVAHRGAAGCRLGGRARAAAAAATVTLAAHLDKLAEEGRLPDGVERACEWPSRDVRRSPPPPPMPPPPVGDSPFPPIADYGFLSDCHTGALVASDGSIEWMCMPHFDSPSVFAAMLDRGAGNFRVGPYGMYVPAGRRYIPGTNVIETTWMTPQGWMRVIDALTISDWHDEDHDTTTHARRPISTPIICWYA